MTVIDGTRTAGTITLPGATLEVLELESVRTGRSRGELVALAVAAMFAPPVEDPAPPGVVAGQGTTRPPAPTIPKVLVPIANPALGFTCTEGGHLGARWWLFPVDEPDFIEWSRSCCDDHIPDGWVLPEVISQAPTVDTIPTPMPHVHLGSRTCVYGDRCGR